MLSKSKKGKIHGYKLVEGKSAKQIMKNPKKKYVGRGIYIRGILPTNLKGSLKKRLKMPRSKRFGSRYR